MKEMNKLKVGIGGYEYTLKSEDSPEHLLKIASKVEEKISLIQNNFPEYSVSRISLLAALQLADELIKLEEDYTQLLDETEKARF